MSMPQGRLVRIHPDHPEPRKIERAADALGDGRLIGWPTDTGYALACGLYNRRGLDLLRKLRGLDAKHPFTFAVANLSRITHYGVVENRDFGYLKRMLPGPYTIVLRSTKVVPRILHNKRKAVGVRVINHPVSQALIEACGEAIITTSAVIEGRHLAYPEEIKDVFGHALDQILDVEYLPANESSVIDLSGTHPKVLREGLGDLSWFEH
jgi:tRNA threonylcarbamoyl adenosine modification protein (Sua5/YciO/YrdC/YwlC family)